MCIRDRLFSCEHDIFITPSVQPPVQESRVYEPKLPQASKTKDKDVVIVTNCAPEDKNLANMIAGFRAVLPYESRVVNLREFPFDGGCLGCFGCAITGKCVYKDGFDEFLRSKIQTADGFVYAFTDVYKRQAVGFPTLYHGAEKAEAMWQRQLSMPFCIRQQSADYPKNQK